MMNVGAERVYAKDGLCTSLAWGRAGQVEYVLEGNINYTGAVTKWLVDQVELLESSKQAGEIAASVPDTGGVYLVPAFSGLGAPYWDGNARAILCGMTSATGKAQIVRAAEECIAYQVNDIVSLMKEQSGVGFRQLNCDGGPTRDRFLMQFRPMCLTGPSSSPKSKRLPVRERLIWRASPPDCMMSRCCIRAVSRSTAPRWTAPGGMLC